jgi:nucleoside 2-deoxyribosyltransferase
MPIASFDGVPAEHWLEVKAIIIEAISSIQEPKFETALVSEADEVGVIHKRIVQGVYSADIVVCDVSGKNPNVLFELGMRLAFDKPTVIIKDDKTGFMFDTSGIEHIEYPRDLRFSRINAFKENLAKKVLATYNASINDPNHTTFLKNFGTFTVAKLSEKEASAEQVILESLAELQKEVRGMRRYVGAGVAAISPDALDTGAFSIDEIETILKQAEALISYGAPEAFNDAYALRPVLRRIQEAESVPAVYRAKANEILQKLPPRRRPQSEYITTRNGHVTQQPNNG